MQLHCILDDRTGDISLYLERTLDAFFTKADTQFPVLLVTGARQVGKTTFLRHLVNIGLLARVWRSS